MSKEELKELLKNNSTEVMHELSASDLVDIKEFVNVSLEIDRKTFDYYYKIDIDELLKSEMPTEEFDKLKNQGWSIFEDKIILFLKS
jgi:hypothetical protein